jgi:uncharacterized protein YggE
MKRTRLFAVAALGMALLLVTACGSAKTTVVTGNGQNQGISVNGTGSIYAAPDVADITIGVQVTDTTVAAARSTAANAQQAVLDSIKTNGVASEDARTVEFQVNPQYDYNGSRQTLRGYQVSNTLTVRVRKLDTLGKVIDDATAAGGNNTIIRNIAFSILDPSKPQAAARDLAVKDAKSHADTLAKTSGVSVGKVISISESTTSVPPPLPYAAAAPRTGAADTSTPIESGQLKVQVNVNVTYAIE